MTASRGVLLRESRHGAVLARELGYADGAVLCEHRHERPYVSVVLDGAYTELRDGLPRRCTPGTAIAHVPDEVHADVFVADGRCVNFELESDEVSALEAIVGAVAARYPALEGALRASLRPEPAPCRAPAWVANVLREFAWIEAVPLAGASRLAGLHPAHFVRAFCRHVGMTPGAYRRRERIRAVSQLLLQTSWTLSRIAQDCGFSDQSHLTNVFRESTGISPHRYRRAFTR